MIGEQTYALVPVSDVQLRRPLTDLWSASETPRLYVEPLGSAIPSPVLAAALPSTPSIPTMPAMPSVALRNVVLPRLHPVYWLDAASRQWRYGGVLAIATDDVTLSLSQLLARVAVDEVDPDVAANPDSSYRAVALPLHDSAVAPPSIPLPFATRTAELDAGRSLCQRYDARDNILAHYSGTAILVVCGNDAPENSTAIAEAYSQWAYQVNVKLVPLGGNGASRCFVFPFP